MLKLFHEYLDASHEMFKNIERPITDTVLRLLNDAYVSVVDEICRAETFPLSVQKVRANLEIIRYLLEEEVLPFHSNPEPGRYLIEEANLVGQYAYFERAMASITRTAVPEILTAQWVETKPLHDTETDSLAITIYNKPIIRVPGITISAVGDTLDKVYFNVYVDQYTTLALLRLSYVRKPEELTLEGVDCLLEPEATCHMVVRKALDAYLNAKTLFTPKQAETQES